MGRQFTGGGILDSLLVAFAVGLVVWLLMRRAVYARARRQMEARRGAGPGPAQDSDTDGTRSMPRIGVPGTVTRDQLARLGRFGFEPSRAWSREEAQLILDAVAYLRAAIRQETGDSDPPIEIQNEVLRIVLTDEALREAVQDWGLNRTREEEGEDRISLAQDETYDRVAAIIDDLWEDETGGA